MNDKENETIFVRDNQSFLDVDETLAKELAENFLKDLGADLNAEVTVTFVDIAEMTRLNSHYRNKQGATDVLSFTGAETNGDTMFVSPVAILGDVIICPEVAAANASGQGHSPLRETLEMMLHGLMHLTGYGHDNDADAAEMFALQSELADKHLKRLG